jgi:hypothetical protein
LLSSGVLFFEGRSVFTGVSGPFPWRDNER